MRHGARRTVVAWRACRALRSAVGEGGDGGLGVGGESGARFILSVVAAADVVALLVLRHIRPHAHTLDERRHQLAHAGRS